MYVYFYGDFCIFNTSLGQMCFGKCPPKGKFYKNTQQEGKVAGKPPGSGIKRLKGRANVFLEPFKVRAASKHQNRFIYDRRAVRQVP